MEKNKEVFWDSYSHKFNSIYGNNNNVLNNTINTLFRQSMKLRFIETVNCIPATANTVLDVGCGPGHFCIELAKKGIPNVHGIDFSESMIELARVNHRNSGIKEEINFEVYDFLKLDDGIKYDYVIMMGFIEYFENPEEILQKAVSKANKKVLASFPKSGGFLAWQRQIRYKSRCFLKLYSKKELSALLDRLGVSSYDIRDASRDFFVEIVV